MKKVREARETGPARDAKGSEWREEGRLRESEVTLAKENGRSPTVEVRGRATGGRGREEDEFETRAKWRSTNVRRGMRDEIGQIWRPEGRLVLEDGAQQDEKVTLSNGKGRGPTASRPFSCEKGRTRIAASRPRATKGGLSAQRVQPSRGSDLPTLQRGQSRSSPTSPLLDRRLSGAELSKCLPNELLHLGRDGLCGPVVRAAESCKVKKVIAAQPVIEVFTDDGRTTLARAS